jgi:hypothetical protein
LGRPLLQIAHCFNLGCEPSKRGNDMRKRILKPDWRLSAFLGAFLLAFGFLFSRVGGTPESVFYTIFLNLFGLMFFVLSSFNGEYSKVVAKVTSLGRGDALRKTLSKHEQLKLSILVLVGICVGSLICGYANNRMIRNFFFSHACSQLVFLLQAFSIRYLLVCSTC